MLDLGEGHEAVALVERSVPLDVAERRQGHRVQALCHRPFADVLDERGTDAAAGVAPAHAHLVEMTFAVDDGRTGVGDGPVRRVHGNPQGPPLKVRTEQLDRRGIGSGDARHPDLGEDLPGVDLDVLQLR